MVATITAQDALTTLSIAFGVTSGVVVYALGSRKRKLDLVEGNSRIAVAEAETAKTNSERNALDLHVLLEWKASLEDRILDLEETNRALVEGKEQSEGDHRECVRMWKAEHAARAYIAERVDPGLAIEAQGIFDKAYEAAA